LRFHAELVSLCLNQLLTMLKRERQAYILHQVNIHNKVLSSTLCQQINVSEDTIRRDLQELADMGKIIKVHGGALSHGFSFAYPSVDDVYSLPQKKIIAQKAVHLIQDGMFILTTGGTTILELARIIPKSLKATFITGSIPVALEYCNHPNIDVILIGDKISKSSRITIGGEAINRIRQINADLCFLGVNAIDYQAGITDNDWDVVQLKKAMIESSQKTVCLSISEKVNSVQPIKVCDIDEIDMIITEVDPDAELLKPYAEKGIKIF
jgi:DeoR/GlpR family transcriptional regulator of sugar metabolism